MNTPEYLETSIKNTITQQVILTNNNYNDNNIHQILFNKIFS